MDHPRAPLAALLVPTLIYGALQPSVYRSYATLLVDRRTSGARRRAARRAAGLYRRKTQPGERDPDAAAVDAARDGGGRDADRDSGARPAARRRSPSWSRSRRLERRPSGSTSPSGCRRATSARRRSTTAPTRSASSAESTRPGRGRRSSPTSTPRRSSRPDAAPEPLRHQPARGVSRGAAGGRRASDCDVATLTCRAFMTREGAVALDTETEQTVQAIGRPGGASVDAPTSRSRCGRPASRAPGRAGPPGAGPDAAPRLRARRRAGGGPGRGSWRSRPSWRPSTSGTRAFRYGADVGRPRSGAAATSSWSAPRRASARLADRLAASPSHSGSGPGDAGRRLPRVAKLRTQITDAEVALSADARSARAS